MSRVWKGSDRPTHENFSLGHVTLLKIFNHFNISGIDEATLIKFGKIFRYFPRKGRGLGHVIVFGMKPRFLKFANASTMESATPEVKNFPRKGCGVGHVTAV